MSSLVGRISLCTAVRALSACLTMMTLARPADASGIKVAAGGDLQAAINTAQAGDTILLQAGATFTGNFVLPVKTGTATITIKSAGLIPATGVRVSPADAVTFPKIRSGNSGTAISTDPAAHDWALVGLEFLATWGGLG